MKLTLSKGRPSNLQNRENKEIKVYDFLDNLRIDYDRVDHEPADTMEACQAINQILAPATICKNLFLCNAGKTKFYLLMIRDDKKFKTKVIIIEFIIIVINFKITFKPLNLQKCFKKSSSGQKDSLTCGS